MKLKIYPLFLLFLMAVGVLSAQNDTISRVSPFTFGASHIGETVANLSGGLQRGACYLGMVNLTVSFDTEKARMWRGGEFFVNGANTHGGTPSASFVGDFQVASNIEAGDRTYMHELWYKQTMGKWLFVVGLQDLNAEFSNSEHSGLFLNSSFGIHSTIADNVPAPIFPLTAFGAQLQCNVTDKITAKVIAFDGFPDDSENNPYNLKWRFERNDGLLSIAELNFEYSLIRNMAGTYKFGAYSHHHFSDDTSLNAANNLADNYGFYLVADQTVFATDGGRALSVFSQASVSPYQKNENWYYLGLGCNYQGLFAKRSADVFGLAVAHAGFEKNNRSSETTIEITYQLNINENIFIQPDLQYVINPSAGDGHLNNATVANLRLGFSF